MGATPTEVIQRPHPVGPKLHQLAAWLVSDGATRAKARAACGQTVSGAWIARPYEGVTCKRCIKRAASHA